MNAPTKNVPIAAIIVVAALSGALASAVVDHAAFAASLPTTTSATIAEQDPRLTALLKYVSVDGSGNVTIQGAKVTINPSQQFTVHTPQVQIEANSTASITSGGTMELTANGPLDISGSITSINS
jgi:hypothetical protein